MRIFNTFFSSNVLLLAVLIAFTFSCDSKKGRFTEKEFENLSEEIYQTSQSLTDNQEQLDQFLKDGDLRKELLPYIKNFYETRDHKLAWINLANIEPQAESLMEQVREAHEHGLDTTGYQLGEIKMLYDTLYQNPIVDEKLAEHYVKLDYTFTAAYFTYGSHLSGGLINPEIADSNWIHYKKEIVWDTYLEDALKSNNIASSFEDLIPGNPQYALLKEKLAEYRALAERDDKPDLVPDGISVKSGDSSEAIGLVKKRLVFWGDMDENVVDERNLNLYDKSLVQAISDFQARHGILEDGKIGPETIQTLNASIQSRINQISLNMERLRWLPEEIGEHYVWVNIPEYEVKIFNDGKEELKMRVIVGEQMNETPIFSDTMEFLVFSPTWTVPKSISTEEMLPKIKEDEDFFEDRNLLLYEDWSSKAEEIDPKDINWKKVDKEDFNFKIVEKPGEGNALGSVKFMFPNSEAIYLHDTPTGHLFEERERGFSHGCIRVEKPKELAAYLLQENDDEKWDFEKITEFMELDTPATVSLKKRLPVHIVYHSAWVDEDKHIHFRKDIYNHDLTQEQAIQKKEKMLM